MKNNKDKESDEISKIIAMRKAPFLEKDPNQKPTPHTSFPVTDLRKWSQKKNAGRSPNTDRLRFWHVVQVIVLLGLTAMLMKMCRG